MRARMGAALALALSLVLGGCQTTGPRGAAAVETAPIAAGQKYFMATHSFNVFIGRAGRGAPEGDPGPLQKLAREAGKAGHEVVGIQMIGGSTPMQHWNQGNGDDSKNIAKVALAKGGIDVFTMSPNALMPEPGIDLFGDLLIKTNPNARLLVQNSWSAWDGQGSTPSVGGSGAPPGFTNEDHDKMTRERLLELRANQDYLNRLRGQLQGINRRAGREMAYVVPSNLAVNLLREQIILGNVPGITQQSQIFSDAMGHPARPLVNLVSYVWFAAMYRQSPVGLMALVDPADATSAARERLLQQIAWNAVVSEPMSGVKGRQVALQEKPQMAAVR